MIVYDAQAEKEGGGSRGSVFKCVSVYMWRVGEGSAVTGDCHV